MKNKVPAFKERIMSIDPAYETFKALKTLQVNLGNLCNLSCTHCHVDASSRGTKIMSEKVIRDIAGFLSNHPDLILDITGGCPEMNPHFKLLIELTDGTVKRRMLRSNIAIMAEKGWEWLPEFCRDHLITIIGSLPCYLEENVDNQRGRGTYSKIITMLKKLNTLGYGKSLELDLVYNPGGSYLPGSQEELENAYKQELFERYGIYFNNLFTITNAPIGRFKEILSADGSYTEYLKQLQSRSRWKHNVSNTCLS